MSTKTVTKAGSIFDYVIHPDAGDTVTFSGGWHGITSDPVPYARIDAYMSPDRGPQIITWLTPEHYEQVNKSVCGMQDCTCGSGLQTNPAAVFEVSTDNYLIPVSTIPDQIYDETL